MRPWAHSGALQPELPAQVNLQRITQHGDRRDATGEKSARAGSFYWLGLFRPHALDAAAAHGRKKSLRLDTHRRGERARRPMQRLTQLGRCARGELEMEPDNVQKYITNEPHERPHGRLRASAMRRSGPTRCCSCRSCRSRLWAVLHARRSVQQQGVCSARRESSLPKHSARKPWGCLRFRHRSTRCAELWRVVVYTCRAPAPIAQPQPRAWTCTVTGTNTRFFSF